MENLGSIFKCQCRNSGVNSFSGMCSDCGMQKEVSCTVYYTKEDVLDLMREAYEAGYKQADVVEAGLESKDVEGDIRWILNKFKKK